MSTTTEREIKVADGLGNADASQVLAGTTFSSEQGFNIEGSLELDSANGITYNDKTVATSLDELYGHVENTNNPHRITKEQIGLENVDNTSDTDKPISTAVQEALDLKASQDDLTELQNTVNENIGVQLSAHTSNTNNPHGVTKAQVGLGNVDNTSDANKPVSTAQQAAINTALTNSKSYTDTKVANLIGSAPETLNTLEEIATAIEENEDVVSALNSAIGTKANQSDLTTHTSNTNNPHSVTKAQVGLGNVDNTSDLNKPISTAVQTALDGKANSSHGNHVPAVQTASNKVFLRNDNTWATITPANIGAAAASHGNHVPAVQTASNKVFLRNDNTWQTITPANIGAAAAHSHPYLSTSGGTVSGAITATGAINSSTTMSATTSMTTNLVTCKKITIQGGDGASLLNGVMNMGSTTGADGSRYYINNNATGRFNALRYTSSAKISSARRYKENIEYIDSDYWHDRLMQVKPCTFTFINDEKKVFNIGVIAEDLQEVIPEFVDYNEDGQCESVYYIEFIIPLLTEVQRLNKINEEQNKRIDELEERLAKLES